MQTPVLGQIACEPPNMAVDTSGGGHQADLTHAQRHEAYKKKARELIERTLREIEAA